jgi:hypothetical protein
MVRKAAILVLAILVFAATASARPVSVLNSDETVTRQGYFLYLPLEHRVNYSKTYISECGVIPDNKDGIIASAPVFAARLAEIAALYHYTGDEKYKELYKKAASAVETIKQKNGFYPYYVTTSCEAATFAEDGEIFQDALTLAGLLIGDNDTMPEVKITKEISYDSCSVGYLTAESESGLPSVCTVLGLEATANESAEETYTEEASGCGDTCFRAGLTVEYRVTDIYSEEIEIRRVWVHVNGSEVEIDPASINQDIVKGILTQTLKDDVRSAFADSILKSREAKRGARNLRGDDVLSSTAAQVFRVVLGQSPDTLDIVRYGKSGPASDIIEECRDVCLYRGAIYIPFLAEGENLTEYRVATKDSLEHLVYISPGWEYSGGYLKAKPELYGWDPVFGHIVVRYYPVREYIFHLAGSLQSMTYWLSGSKELSLVVQHYAQAAKAPAGTYKFEDMQQTENTTFRTVALVPRVAEAYRDPANRLSRERLVLVPTLSWKEAWDMKKQAFEERDALKLFVAVDNLYAHSIGKSPTSPNAVLLATMMSLSEERMKEYAKDHSRDGAEYRKILDTLLNFKKVFHDLYLPVAHSAVKGDLIRGEPSMETRVLLAVLADKAKRAGIPDFYELYADYSEYFGEHTKNYTNLKRLAEAYPEAKRVIDLIEARKYEEAQEALQSVEGDDVRSILSEEISRRIAAEIDIVGEAMSALEQYTRGETSAQEALNMVREALAVKQEPRLSAAERILSAVVSGSIPEDNAKGSLRALLGISKPEQVAPEEKKITPPPHVQVPETQEEVQTQETEQKEDRRPLVLGIALFAAVAVTAVVLALRRRKKVMRR